MLPTVSAPRTGMWEILYNYVCITDVGLYHQPPADLQVGIKISSELLRSINVFYVFNAAL